MDILVHKCTGGMFIYVQVYIYSCNMEASKYCPWVPFISSLETGCFIGLP